MIISPKSKPKTFASCEYSVVILIPSTVPVNGPWNELATTVPKFVALNPPPSRLPPSCGDVSLCTSPFESTETVIVLLSAVVFMFCPPCTISVLFAPAIAPLPLVPCRFIVPGLLIVIVFESAVSVTLSPATRLFNPSTPFYFE